MLFSEKVLGKFVAKLLMVQMLEMMIYGKCINWCKFEVSPQHLTHAFNNDQVLADAIFR